MKKIIITLLLFCYLIPVIGVSVSAHYCGERLTAISFDDDHGHDCPCGSKSMKRNCCKDKVSFVKLNDSQEKTILATVCFDKVKEPIHFYTLCLAILYGHQPLQTVRYKTHPPDNTRQPVYLVNRVFRI